MSTKTKEIKDNFAVIKTGGKQYTVSVDDTLRVEKLEGEEGDSITFDSVLLTANDDDVSVGTPELKATVEAEILEHGRGKKIHGLKFKRKKDYMRRWGHRQDYTKVKITKIG
ncbi:MAG: 50S ribosomal protein L21 [Candidatus Paceibacterota bacterium]